MVVPSRLSAAPLPALRPSVWLACCTAWSQARAMTRSMAYCTPATGRGFQFASKMDTIWSLAHLSPAVGAGSL